MTDDDHRNMAIFWALVIGFIIAGLFLAQPVSADFYIGGLEAGTYAALGGSQSAAGADVALQLGTVEPDWLFIGDLAAHHAFYADVLVSADGGGPEGAGIGASLSLKPIGDGETEDDNLRLLGAITDDWQPTFGISYRTGFSPEDWF